MSAAESLRLTMAALMETNHDLALKMLREAIEADPSASLPRFHLATILGSRGLHEQAAEALEQAFAVEATVDPGMHFLYARQLHLSGSVDEARAEYELVLKLDAACEKAHLYLAQIIALAGDDRDIAAEHARQAVMLRPSTSMVRRAEFTETYEQVVGEALPSDVYLDETRAEALARLPVGDVLFLHPRAASVLEECGIHCSECSGYSVVPLGDAARDAHVDLPILLNRLTALMAAEEV